MLSCSVIVFYLITRWYMIPSVLSVYDLNSFFQFFKNYRNNVISMRLRSTLIVFILTDYLFICILHNSFLLTIISKKKKYKISIIRPSQLMPVFTFYTLTMDKIFFLNNIRIVTPRIE